ncbi:hypothetical protein [Streptomyces glaucus]|uniref:YbjN domain-containing protein n=1 Tax=Streptomyces glaucus TaxID=284029 RepID=A0ABN3J315_9ACTN
MAGKVDKPQATAELESALRSLGAEDGAFIERWEGGAWVADWDGSVRGHDVHLFVMGADNHPEAVRLMLDDFTFENVRTEHLGELVRKVFTGDARVTRSRFPLLPRHLVLDIRVGPETYSASVSGNSVDDLSSWARRLAAP